MDWRDYIHVDPEIVFGKPVVAGTRIPVYMVLELIEAGFTSEQIIRDYYPTLTPEAIQACLSYATTASGAEIAGLAAPGHTGDW